MGVALFNVALYTSLNYMSPTAASLFLVLGSPLTGALTALSSKRRPPPVVALGGALSAAGAYFILQPYIQGNSLAGTAQALATTTSWELYTIYVRRIYSSYAPAEA